MATRERGLDLSPQRAAPCSQASVGPLPACRRAAVAPPSGQDCPLSPHPSKCLPLLPGPEGWVPRALGPCRPLPLPPPGALGLCSAARATRGSSPALGSVTHVTLWPVLFLLVSLWATRPEGKEVRAPLCPSLVHSSNGHLGGGSKGCRQVVSAVQRTGSW